MAEEASAVLSGFRNPYKAKEGPLELRGGRNSGWTTEGAEERKEVPAARTP